MKPFMDKDFLLSTPTARTLFHEFAEKAPILDYHCHINPREIAEDRRFDNITQLWLGGDHYKWRLMRSFGVDEAYITDGNWKVSILSAAATPTFAKGWETAKSGDDNKDVTLAVAVGKDIPSLLAVSFMQNILNLFSSSTIII